MDNNGNFGIDENGEIEKEDEEEIPELYDPDAPKKINKGETINLTEASPSIRKVMIGMGWEVRSFEGESVDMDASAFLLNPHGLTREDSDFVFYNNLTCCNGAVNHTGDNRTGAGDGDDETMFIALNELPFDVEKIVFVVSIYKGEEQNQDFEQVRDTFLRVVNEETRQELCRFDIDAHTEPDAKTTAMTVGALLREGQSWSFQALGELEPGGIVAVADRYGIITQY